MFGFKQQMRSLPKSLRNSFRELGTGQRRSLRALADIGEIAIAPILRSAQLDPFGLGLERYGVAADQQDFQLYAQIIGENFFSQRGDRDFAFLPQFDACCDRIIVDPNAEYKLVQGSGSRPSALLYEVQGKELDLIAVIAGNTTGLQQFGGTFYSPDLS